jgi:hypothetical protein
MRFSPFFTFAFAGALVGGAMIAITRLIPTVSSPQRVVVTAPIPEKVQITPPVIKPAAALPVKRPEADFYARRPATIECVLEAARRQRVPANVLLAIASMEGGKNGQMVPNANGSYDLGHFQINSGHFTGQFARFPIKQVDVVWRGCYNAELAGWMLRKHLEAKNGQDFWTRVANYHSKTPEFNDRYQNKVRPLAVKWGQWLEKRYAKSVSIEYVK